MRAAWFSRLGAVASFGCALALSLGSSAHARPRVSQVWSVSESSDPITGVRRCVVAAFDRSWGMSFTRSGYLYPFVENNSQMGILIGVSSGGTYRLPTGNILWRVDDLPFRELRAADNPMPDGSTPQPIPTDMASLSRMDMTAYQARLVQTMTATATVAGGQRGQEMLAELLAGHSLIFRSAAVAPAYGLPSQSTQAVGQITNEGLRPIPVDQSLRDGMARCGIPLPTPTQTTPPAAPLQ